MKPNMKQHVQPKDIIDKFMLSLRNYELYPEHHAVTQASVTDCMEILSDYLEAGEPLSLTISEGQILHDDAVVFQADPGEENPAYQMYRDGIESLVFHQGMNRDEFQRFLKILRHHSVSRNKEESDIVTDLWGEDFSCISYETTDVFWKDEPVLDFSSVRVIDADTLSAPEPSNEESRSASISEIATEPGMFELSPEERKQTAQMVHEEEHRNFDVDIFDVLLVILKEQREEDDFAVVLDIIAESFQNALERAEFSSAIRFFRKLEEVEDIYRENPIWAKPHLEDFKLIISSNQVLASLNKAWPNIDAGNPAQLDDLQTVLTSLLPLAIHSLCPMIQQVASPVIQRQLIESVTLLAEKDGRPLRKLLAHPDKNVVQNAVFILGHIPGEEETRALQSMLRTATGTLRHEVVKSLAKQKPVLAEVLLPLVNDSDSAVRKIVITRLGSERNAQSEDYLIDSINHLKFTKKEIGALMKLYRTLGGCGSATAVPFLKKQLSRRSLFARKVAAAHREGAALALGLLKLPEAESILAKRT